ncbi:ABC-type multidrug transport system permease subunit [Geobacillus subterraneus]
MGISSVILFLFVVSAILFVCGFVQKRKDMKWAALCLFGVSIGLASFVIFLMRYM